jgi:hypothetical protein
MASFIRTILQSIQSNHHLLVEADVKGIRFVKQEANPQLASPNADGDPSSQGQGC